MNPKSRRDQPLLHSPGTGENLNLTQSDARDSPASVGTARVMSSTCSCSSIQSTLPATAATPISSCTLYLSSPGARLLIAPSCLRTAAFNPFLSPGPAPLPPGCSAPLRPGPSFPQDKHQFLLIKPILRLHRGTLAKAGSHSPAQALSSRYLSAAG